MARVLCVRGNRNWPALWLCATGLLGAFAVQAQTPLPHIFFSDIESGPNSGGENGLGAYVTIYGKNFGATRGSSSITIGGGAAAAYPLWSDGKVTLQLGASAATGAIQVTTSAGASNGLPFTVRAGNIYFISTSGNDSANGSFATPWKTILQARSMAAGDITYAMNGVAQTTDDGTGWSAALTLGANDCGTGLPRALVAYPGATVTIGTITGPTHGIRASNPSSRGGACQGAWVFAGINLRGTTTAIGMEGPSNTWRVVGNDMTCPNGNDATACAESSQASNIKFYGNNVHDTGVANATALYHGVYFSTDSNHIDMGWNTVANVHGCRGIQIHSSPLQGGGANDPTGHNQYDISIHDNVIHDTQCDGIIFATVDPSQGKVEAYNNIIYNAGKGPNNPEGSGNWACIYVAGYTNTGPAGGGTADVYNNTMYNCGTFANPPYAGSEASVMNGGHNTALNVRIRNNIMYQPASVPYLVTYGPSGSIFGSNNLFFGGGAIPAGITASLNVDPQFANLAGPDFHLKSSSPAATAGINSGIAYDFDGVALPQGAGYPIGAYAYSVGGTPSVSVSVAPTSVSLQATKTAQFTATTVGSTNMTVNWTMSPQMGTLSSSGLYTAPASIAASQSITITAALASDATKFATALVALTPTAKPAISLSPTSSSLNQGQTQQFTAAVAGTSSTQVTWSISPVTGTISTAGLYTAPATVSSTQTVTVKATLVADATVFATATVTLNPAPVSATVSISPTSASLSAGQTQPFSATVGGTGNTQVNWSVSPATGSISATGLYTAPASVASQQSVTVTVALAANPAVKASATVTINPQTSTSLSLSPSLTSLSNGQKQQFVAAIKSSASSLTATTPSVAWSLSSPVGAISTSGLYTAPSTIASATNVTVKAALTSDPTKWATATVSLKPGNGFSLSFTEISTTQLQLTWSAPAHRAFNDWVSLTSPGAPNWYHVWQRSTNGASTGTVIVPRPVSPGDYEFRYFTAGTYNLMAVSKEFDINNSGFSLSATPATVTHGQPLTITWNAPAGRPKSDWLVLIPAAAASDQYQMYWNTNGSANGSVTIPAPAKPGLYELRYLNGYVSIQTVPVLVQ